MNLSQVVAKFLFPESYESADSLSARELQIASMCHLRIDDIALAFGISPRTVATHLVNIRRKLDLSSRSEICAWYSRQSVREDLTQAQAKRIAEFCCGPQDVEWVAKWFGVSEQTVYAVIEAQRRPSPHAKGVWA